MDTGGYNFVSAIINVARSRVLILGKGALASASRTCVIISVKHNF